MTSTSPLKNNRRRTPMMNEALHVVVVGGGAAGLIAAGCAARRGYRVTVIERNPRPARKVMITGKGRCNVTNDSTVADCVANVPGNGRFLYSAFSSFTPQDTMQLFEELGVPLKTERGRRVFPVSDKAVDIVDALVRYARFGGTQFVTGRVTRLLVEDGVCCGVELENGSTIEAYGVIVCTGGCSYPGTGSTGDGYALAGQAGHTVVPPRPSLVPLVVSTPDCADMQGLSLRNCSLSVTDTATGKTLFEDFGELLFTHFGVSGPLVLSASAHIRDMQPNRYRLTIDLKPALTPEQVDARLVREAEQKPNACLGNMLAALLPRSLIVPVLNAAAIPGETKCHSVSREMRRRLGEVLKGFSLTVQEFRPLAEAIVTAGGVSTKEINSKTMASRLVSGLSFAGEVIDVDAYTGGFNLQIAFSTGMAAGNHI
ncbi:MAG: NAD(P)/FAD-dependent oxidoreductase [Clostridia bacterium]|nr:NAD(P)/FAD-dependent oxidoreductase [Clostridia bacterium]